MTSLAVRAGGRVSGEPDFYSKKERRIARAPLVRLEASSSSDGRQVEHNVCVIGGTAIFGERRTRHQCPRFFATFNDGFSFHSAADRRNPAMPRRRDSLGRPSNRWSAQAPCLLRWRRRRQRKISELGSATHAGRHHRLRLLVCILADPPARKEPPAGPELAAITEAGGHDLAALTDAAAWHASDAIRRNGPAREASSRYIARKTEKGWAVAFGRLDDKRQKFLMAYEAAHGDKARCVWNVHNWPHQERRRVSCFGGDEMTLLRKTSSNAREPRTSI